MGVQHFLRQLMMPLHVGISEPGGKRRGRLPAGHSALDAELLRECRDAVLDDAKY